MPPSFRPTKEDRLHPLYMRMVICYIHLIMKKLFLIAVFAVFISLAVSSASTAGIVSGLGKGVHIDKDTHTGKGVHIDKDTHTGKGVHLDKDTHTGKGVHIDKDTHTGKGVHLSDLYDSKGSHSADHVHTKGGAGIELDKKAPCDSIFDCGCFGCQKSDGAVAAFLSVAESYVPEQYMVSVRAFVSEYLPKTLDVIYEEFGIDQDHKPPQH